ncbi:MAG: transposase [Candidatus Doudnabacteria bacterium]|nr:transposase [Candidatus Doudnabacteria bacterium]
MIGRDYKPNFEGAYFHAYNRGVNKEPIFLDEQDYSNFIFRAKILLGVIPLPKRTAKGGLRLKVLPMNALEILCYCLMPNHFHFLVKQGQKGGLKIFLHRLCTSYSSYFNKKYKRVGHIFQGVYKSKAVLEDSYLTQLTAYIHLNPERPFEWKYSSMGIYLGKEPVGLANPAMFMEMHNLTFKNYRNFLETNYMPEQLSVADLTFEED